MSSLKVFPLLLVVIISFGQLHINDTFTYSMVCSFVDLFLNFPSSSFPGSSFLNHILYGYDNQTFGFKDFYNNYGYSVTDFYAGDIVLGLDGKLGGIVDQNWSIVIPIPNGKVMAIPKSLLKKYFPKGYIFKHTTRDDYGPMIFSGFLTSYLNNQTFCKNCYAEIGTYYNISDIYQGLVFYFYQFNGTNGTYVNINLYGYLDQYDNQTRNGTWTISFVQTIELPKEIFRIHMVFPNISNSVSFSIDFNDQLSFKGLVPYIDGNQIVYYSFYGQMVPHKSMKKADIY